MCTHVQELFDLQRGVSMSEIEFPAFFSFFVLKRKVMCVRERVCGYLHPCAHLSMRVPMQVCMHP